MNGKIILAEIIKNIENLDDYALIYAVKNPIWEMDSQAIVLECDEYAEDDPEAPENMTYMISGSTAKEVLEVWRMWREGKIPNETERFDAIIYYAENDAYIREGL